MTDCQQSVNRLFLRSTLDNRQHLKHRLKHTLDHVYFPSVNLSISILYSRPNSKNYG